MSEIVKSDGKRSFFKHHQCCGLTALTCFLLLIPTLFFVSCVSAGKNVLRPGATVDVSDIKGSMDEPYAAYLRMSGMPPVDYMVEKFKKHDVVILGEEHQVAETCEFIASLMEPLYHRAGVRYFAMEIFYHKATPKLNALVTGQTFDRDLALRLFRQEISWPIWGFREYMDILEAIWLVNHALAPGAERLKVIGIQRDDMDMYQYACGSWWANLRQRWIQGFGDKDLAQVVTREILQKNKKALVQIGSWHTPVRYRHPVVINGKFRWELRPKFGYLLGEKHGDRIFQVVMHSGGFPASGFFERIARSNENKPVGFDIEASPLANLRDRGNEYFKYQQRVVFSDVAQGYVYLKPTEDLQMCHWIDGFINDENFEKAKAIFLKEGVIKGECRTPAELEKKMKNGFQYQSAIQKAMIKKARIKAEQEAARE